MADLVNGVARDVLRAIAIEKLKSKLIVILRSLCDAAQLCVLLPEIALNQFGCRKEAQNCYVALTETAVLIVVLAEGRHDVSGQHRAYCYGTRCLHSSRHKSTTVY